ncbi:MAG: putative bifunctional diguanylate cyclase/phosphodiesterase [Sphingobium sp.]
MVEKLVRWDQLVATRKNVMIALQINALLGMTTLLVAWHGGNAALGLIWFLASCAVNLWRVAILLHLPEGDLESRPVEKILRRARISAFVSGLVWATVPILCDGYSSPQTLFYLIVVCGITAGAITHGTAYSPVPIGFILPPLTSMFLCLLYQGEVEHLCLAATVILYITALIRSARTSEKTFKDTSRLKNNATSTARFLQDAYERSCKLASDLHEWAMHDELTGLLNRRGLMEKAKAEKAPGRNQCLMMLDLDGFKAVNDGYGHQAGDRLLREVGRRIVKSVPPGALVARLGGDEFAILLDIEADPPIDTVAHALLTRISQPFELMGAGRIGCSIGIHIAHDLAFEDRLSCADEALYTAKIRGRNQFHIFDEELRQRFEMRRNIERDLMQAIADRSIEIWFQPIVDGREHRITSIEALLRWHHPLHGLIAPPEIVSEAAKSGCSAALLEFILDRACDLIEGLQAIGAEGISTGINISPREIAQLPIDTLILSTLEQRNIPYSAMEIEVTEETVLDVPVVQEKIAAIAGKGVRIAIDDFGVGYSSLALLKNLQVDRVKVDRCFVTGLDEAKDNRALLRAIMMLGNTMGFEIVAEGVETDRDAIALQLLGCDAMQGYFFHRPMPADQLLQVVQRQIAQDRESALSLEQGHAQNFGTG